MTFKIIKIETDDEIHACFDVLSQLRPSIKKSEFLKQIRNQYKRGYLLAALMLDGDVIAVAGFHLKENLAWGKHLYVEDLITEQTQRSNGFGKKLLTWLHNYARENDCNQLHLDSGIQRKDAHCFYEREGMMFASHHYVSIL